MVCGGVKATCASGSSDGESDRSPTLVLGFIKKPNVWTRIEETTTWIQRPRLGFILQLTWSGALSVGTPESGDYSELDRNSIVNF